MELKSLIGDQQAQAEGVWVEYNEGVSFKLVYSESPKPRDFFTKRLNKVRNAKYRNKPIPLDVTNEITTQMLVEHVVTDWKGITVDGKDHPFTKKNLRDLLDQSPLLRDWISTEAADGERFGIVTPGTDTTAENDDADGDDDEPAADAAPEGSAAAELQKSS